MPVIVIKDAQTGEVIERDMTPEEEALFVKLPKTQAELEDEVQAVADALLTSDQEQGEQFKALALATVDLRMADVSGLTTAQVRQAFRDRIVFYLRQRRGL